MASFLNETKNKQLDAQLFDEPAKRALRAALDELGGHSIGIGFEDPAMPGCDAQTKAAFALGPRIGKKTAEAAEALCAAFNRFAAGVAVASPSGTSGFCNIRFEDEWIEESLAKAGTSWARLDGLSMVVDYSSPNCAKRMHVGHLRSSVIGESICRLGLAHGAEVQRVNHIGDWGTPFGIIIEQSRLEGSDLARLDLEAIEGIYQRGSKAYKDSEQSGQNAFAQDARDHTARMQKGLEPQKSAWKSIIEATMAQMQSAYERLGIGLLPEHAIGESRYQELAQQAIEELCRLGLASMQNGGAAYLGGKTPLPLSKSFANGGGLLYGGTDAAALRLRGATGANLVYVTDERQSGHFQSLFKMGEQAGWTSLGQAFHAAFGMMLDTSGAPFKSRDGGAMPLEALLDLAVQGAKEALVEKTPDLDVSEASKAAESIGIASLKFADLSRNRASSFKFDPKAACRLDGDTAPYLFYARARALSAAARAKGREAQSEKKPLAEKERALALELLRLRGKAAEAFKKLEPHILCQGLIQCAKSFMSFYEACPCVDNSGLADQRRVRLMELAAEAIGKGMEEGLGIKPVDRMPKSAPRP